MALEEALLAELRSWLGDETPPTDEELEELYALLGSSVSAVVLHVLRSRRALLLSGSLDFTTEDGYHEKNVDTVKAIDALIASIETGGIDGGSPDVTITQLHRGDTARSR